MRNLWISHPFFSPQFSLRNLGLMSHHYFDWNPIQMTVDYTYNGTGYYNIYMMSKPQHLINISLHKQFMEGKLTVALEWRDILNQSISHYNMEYKSAGYSQVEDQNRSYVGVSLKYRLNKPYKLRSIVGSDEVKRLQ